jgi:hypothetical protein
MDTFFLFIVENFIAFSLLLIFISLLIIHESRKGGKKIDSTEVTRLIKIKRREKAIKFSTIKRKKVSITKKGLYILVS